MNAIQMQDLTKRYKELTAVDGLSLTVAQGELFALLGDNGAGKTTTIKMLCGLTRPTTGQARLLGLPPEKAGSILGVSPQETAVAPQLSVRENLELICGIYGFSGKKAQNRVETITHQLGLSSVLGRKAGVLSGGWQRRLSIAMALVSQPKILFLDEPTLGLDVLARQELWEVIRSLKGSITVVLTTHYMQEAESLADRIGIMGGGRLLALGSAGELKAQTGKATLEDAFVAIVREVHA